MISPTRSSFGERELPNTLYTTHIIKNINKKMETITRKPPVLPKSAIAIVGTTDRVAAHGTAHDIAIASTRCPQLSTTRVPVVPAMVQPSPMKNGIIVFPCRPTFDMVLSKRNEIRARYPVSSIRLKPKVMPNTNEAITDLLSQLGINVEHLTETFCSKNGLYLHRMNDEIHALVKEVWEMKDFRKKRMEKAAELLESTPLKVIDIANVVGYENHGKFA